MLLSRSVGPAAQTGVYSNLESDEIQLPTQNTDTRRALNFHRRLGVIGGATKQGRVGAKFQRKTRVGFTEGVKGMDWKRYFSVVITALAVVGVTQVAAYAQTGVLAI
jgi:hypothetical protein